MDFIQYFTDIIEKLINRNIEKIPRTKEFLGSVEKVLGPSRYQINYDNASREFRTKNNLALKPLDRVHVIYPNGVMENRYLLEDVANNTYNLDTKKADLVALSLVSNLTSVGAAIVQKTGNVCRIRIVANTTAWAANTLYNVCTLPEEYRPTDPVQKSIIIRTASSVAISAQLVITTAGLVQVGPMSAISGLQINIDEVFIGGK